jgi:hypothetical protein
MMAEDAEGSDWIVDAIVRSKVGEDMIEVQNEMSFNGLIDRGGGCGREVAKAWVGFSELLYLMCRVQRRIKTTHHCEVSKSIDTSGCVLLVAAFCNDCGTSAWWEISEKELILA